jgi:hypothetical protein
MGYSCGNEEVRAASYDEVRNFIINGDEPFDLNRIHLDSRYIPQSDGLQHNFGKFFNLIYIRSDHAGRVVAHFTLCNVISWQIILAASGGTSDTKVG